MKALVCEMCNSSDVVKDGDFFVCQACGMKYTTEAARKLMTEVVVDNSAEIENRTQTLMRLYKTGYYEEAWKSANEILNLDSKNPEAILVYGLCTAIRRPEELTAALKHACEAIDEQAKRKGPVADFYIFSANALGFSLTAATQGYVNTITNQIQQYDAQQQQIERERLEEYRFRELTGKDNPGVLQQAWTSYCDDRRRSMYTNELIRDRSAIVAPFIELLKKVEQRPAPINGKLDEETVYYFYRVYFEIVNGLLTKFMPNESNKALLEQRMKRKDIPAQMTRKQEDMIKKQEEDQKTRERKIQKLEEEKETNGKRLTGCIVAMLISFLIAVSSISSQNGAVYITFGVIGMLFMLICAIFSQKKSNANKEIEKLKNEPKPEVKWWE